MGRTWVAVAATRLAAGRVEGWTDSAEGVPSEYLLALRRAGLDPATIGPPADLGDADDRAAVAGLLDPWSGLLLCGGADVDPARFGAAPHPTVYGIDGVRDRFETALVRAALDARLPVLAVCRGIQVVNVALGGTLIQHLPDLAGTGSHGVPVGAGVPATHPVAVTPGSRLAGVLGGAARLDACISIHHQAVDAPAPGLTVTARSPDGVVEALETGPDDGWCLAVQWHPERSARADPAQQAVFDGFAAAVRAHAAPR